MEIQSQYDHFVGGEWLKPASGEYMDSQNPHDGSVAARIAVGTAADVDAAVQAAQANQRIWREMRPIERGRCMGRLAGLVRDHMDTLAEAESVEMGMPHELARKLLVGAADYLDYYGGLAPSIQGEQIPIGADRLVYTIYEPYGVIGLITPWNAPLNQAARDGAPALAAGNCLIHKPSEHSSVSALMFAELFTQAGFPTGVYNVLTGLGADVGAALVEHPQVAKVSFTGSVPTGTDILRRAADKIMPVTLELGGKSPDIIFDDADLDAAVQGALNGLVLNTGQICSAGTRILVQRSVYDKVAKQMTKAMSELRVGRDEAFPCLGPLANNAQYKKVLGYFDVAKDDGAELLIGGGACDEEALKAGLYVQPTLYGEVHNDMRIAREEIFGPVGVLVPFEDEDEAVSIANDSPYGLVAGLWSQNVSRAHRVAARLEVGQVFVNDYGVTPVEAPFGGFKKSGMGREKGMISLKQSTQVKTVNIKLC